MDRLRALALQSLLLSVWFVFVSCSSEPQVGPRVTDIEAPESVVNNLTVLVESNRTDLNANGQDRAQIRATVLDGVGRPSAGRSVFFLLNTQGYTGDKGTLSEESGVTDESGQVVTIYTAPALSFVPPDSGVVVTAMIADPEIAFAPSASVTILFAAMGSPSPPGPSNG